MDFEDLHEKVGSGTNVGVDLTTLMTSQVAVSTAGDSGAGGGAAGSDQTVPRIASFQVYWDVQAKQFKVFNPKVVNPSGNEIAVTETVLSRGTFVCEVKKNAATGIYTAAIKLTDAVVPSSDTVTVVKLFKIADGKVEQYHVGAIILTGSLTGEQGATEGSDPEQLFGNVSMSGETNSGLKVKTTRQSGAKIDIVGRDSNDVFRSREVKNSNGETIAKVFGTAGFKLGGGGPDNIDVITGGEFKISGNYLQVKWTKKKIKAVTIEDVTTDWENAMTLDEITVPTDLAYSESTVEFTQKKQTILVPHADPAQDDEAIFTATPHSAEATN